MRDDDFDRLVNDELDGVGTPDQKALLARRLAESESSRARYQEIQSVFGMLDRVESVEPPASLRGDVLRAVESRARARSERPGWRGLLQAGFGRRPGLGLGYAFAAGAVVGGLVLALGTGLFERRWDGADAGGAMMPPAAARPVDAIRLAVKGAQASGEAWTTGVAGVGVRIEIQAAGPFEAHVTFDPERYAVMSLRRGEPSGGRLDLRRGDAVLGDRGQGRFELILRAVGPDRPPVRLEIRTPEGGAQGVLRVRPPG